MSYYESLRTTDILWNTEHASRRSEIKIRNVCMLMKKLADIFSLAVFMQLLSCSRHGQEGHNIV